ncbi:MAG TPA: PilC/PilY family type IV pilus protein, partial [Gammaproteobacteria bacterium]|nr:PilC/PilY family type IV pilus protein [Gammaproteobacteria bacterium]
LWHAAINGRGDYLSAGNPNALVTAFKSVLSQISSRTSSFSSAALSSGSLTTNTELYTAEFDPGDWSGHLKATKIMPDGTLGSVSWDAACLLTGTTLAGGTCTATAQDPSTGRSIITVDSGTGIPFRWNDLNSSQQADLNKDPVTGNSDGKGSARLDYLRGARDNEQSNSGNFRDRTDVLGDIIHSSPVYVGAPDRYYSNLPEGSSYDSFKTSNASRIPVVYAGGNDGMLHAFSATTGKELLGFVPSVLMSGLNQLTSPQYAHRYYVDGTPTEADAYYNSAWHTVLVGGLGGGGREIYALDITHPGNFSESNASNIVKWEFTAASHPDLGYTFSRPQVVRLSTGDWVAIFGNGYNGADTSGSAHLYVVKLSDGTLIKRIDTPAQTDPLVTNGTLSTNRPDGLATVEPVDTNGDQVTDYVYAGDLYGNLWKFDLTSSNTNQWGVSYNAPLFTAKDANGNPQPITTKPTVGRNPARPGYIVYFGTGKYLETSDAAPNTNTVQSVYGIWDKDGSKLQPITRSALQQQQISNEVNQFGQQIRLATQNTIDWSTQMGWYMDLDPVGVAPQGEMVVSDPLLRNGKLIYTTIIPNGNACSDGGDSWLMEVDAETGGQLNYSPFDFNQDGTFDLRDYTTVTRNGKKEKVPGSGVKSKKGLYSKPTVLSNCKGAECKYLQGSSGKTTTLHENTGPNAQGRQSWRQIR